MREERKKKVLLPLSRIETFPAGATIVKFGEKAENFYVLEDGYVRLVLNSTCGDKKSTIDATDDVQSLKEKKKQATTAPNEKQVMENIMKLEVLELKLKDMVDMAVRDYKKLG